MNDMSDDALDAALSDAGYRDDASKDGLAAVAIVLLAAALFAFVMYQVI
ncbi:MAG: hypothetical protein ACRBI6_21635 [Acidimicrobiales bacterium]